MPDRIAPFTDVPAPAAQMVNGATLARAGCRDGSTIPAGQIDAALLGFNEI